MDSQNQHETVIAAKVISVGILAQILPWLPSFDAVIKSMTGLVGFVTASLVLGWWVRKIFFSKQPNKHHKKKGE